MDRINSFGKIKPLEISKHESASELYPKKANWISCYISLTSTIVGAGMLGTPYVLAKGGWVIGTMILTFSALCSAFGAHLLSVCALRSTYPVSFYSVAESSIPGYSILVEITVLVKSFGVATSYLLVIGDSIPLVTQQYKAPYLLQDRSICLIFCFLFLGPLACLPNLDSLKVTSSISGLMIILVSILIVLYALSIPYFDPCPSTITSYTNADDENLCRGYTSLLVMNAETIKCIPISCFAFGCQQNIFSVVNELQNPTQFKVDTVVIASVSTALFLYFCIAFAGYSTFGNHLNADILKMYPEGVWISISRVLLSLIVMCHYPLQVIPARISAISIATYCFPSLISSSDQIKYLCYIIVTILFVGFSMLISLLVHDLGISLAIVGATGSSLVIFILPGYFYYSMFSKDNYNILHNEDNHFYDGIDDSSKITIEKSNRIITREESRNSLQFSILNRWTFNKTTGAKAMIIIGFSVMIIGLVYVAISI